MFCLQRSLLLLSLVASISLAEPIEWQDATAAAEGGSPLYALWSSWTGEALNLTTVDPSTGAQGPILWASTDWMLFFPLTPALDHQGKRLFVPLVNITGQSVSLGVFDLSQAGRGHVTLQKTIPVLGSYFFSLHYDAVDDKVWMISTYMQKRSLQSAAANANIWMESVDISRGVSKNVTTLPDNLTVAADGLGGAPAAFDEKNRVLLVPTRTLDSSPQYYWSAFHLANDQWRSSPLAGFVPVAMYWDSQTASLFALMTSLLAQTGPLSFGTINTLTGKADVFNTWNSTTLVFAVGALAAYDSASAQFYSLVGSGTGPPVALTTISAKTGTLKSAPYFGRSQPDSLSCFN